jgi:hypothetical protein
VKEKCDDRPPEESAREILESLSPVNLRNPEIKVAVAEVYAMLALAEALKGVKVKIAEKA